MHRYDSHSMTHRNYDSSGVKRLKGRFGKEKSVKLPSDYNRMLTCTWSIEVDPGKGIEIHVPHMRTSTDCLQDYISIIDGKTQNEREIAR